MPIDTRITLEAAEDRLKQLGWSVGDLAYFHHGRQVWQVYAHRRRHKIVTRALTKWQAWQAAARMAARLRKRA